MRQVKLFYDEDDANAWLKEHADLKIIDVKLGATDETNTILVVYDQ
ncbi:MAG: hypothetical protein ACLFP2_01250 [Candidatus Woesearchaeota archaeon]